MSMFHRRASPHKNEIYQIIIYKLREIGFGEIYCFTRNYVSSTAHRFEFPEKGRTKNVVTVSRDNYKIWFSDGSTKKSGNEKLFMNEKKWKETCSVKVSRLTPIGNEQFLSSFKHVVIVCLNKHVVLPMKDELMIQTSRPTTCLSALISLGSEVPKDAHCDFMETRKIYIKFLSLHEIQYENVLC